MGLRTTVSWVLRGHDNTMRSLASLSTDLQALQQRVDELSRSVAADVSGMREQHLAEFAATRDAVTNATDDLAGRVAALRRDLDARR